MKLIKGHYEKEVESDVDNDKESVSSWSSVAGESEDRSSLAGDDKKKFTFGKGAKSEIAFFEKLQHTLHPESFDNVIKLLYLYSECVIGADEMFLLVEPSFKDELDLFEYFKDTCLNWE